ncbi:hypothetical protein FH972_018104 [Carpinus fangiana]|uniref:Protein kinase domain-containing protein n=1 Tax=Carpinus fangiana TaxID=176857 RepID=A0A5N6RPG9_9ROSI|nr:hypothetical protein FH972_018104 [Carpinus fangiana]
MGIALALGVARYGFRIDSKILVLKYRALIITPKYGTSIPAAMLLSSRKASSTCPLVISKIILTKRLHWCLIGQLAISHVKKLETNRILHAGRVPLPVQLRKQGYQGNPYLLQGHGVCNDIDDIDECGDQTLNNCTNHCFNTQGSYKCSCPKLNRGDGRKDGEGCSVDVTCTSNYGFHCGSEQGRSTAKKAKIFTYEELKEATNNYEESRIIGKGGFGHVFKGFLPNNTIVAIKKSETVDPDQANQFIKEIIQLSEIDHENVVKLLTVV